MEIFENLPEFGVGNACVSLSIMLQHLHFHHLHQSHDIHHVCSCRSVSWPGEFKLYIHFFLKFCQMEAFMEERFNLSETLFWDAISSLKIKTFESLSQRTKVKTHSDKMFTIAADRDLFARLIISAKSRDIKLKEVLNYELSTVLHWLTHANGTLRKTTKSALLEKEGQLTERQLHT